MIRIHVEWLNQHPETAVNPKARRSRRPCRRPARRVRILIRRVFPGEPSSGCIRVRWANRRRDEIRALSPSTRYCCPTAMLGEAPFLRDVN